ncbi:hypothetical protein DVH05_008001 [Phytophthora capsici]|nr:hypothetical protein DVH05_008001 [Phytophthora capsici]
MSEASSSSAQSRDPSSSPAWLTTQSMERSSRHGMVRTTEKSVVFRVRTQEKVSGSRGGRRSQQMLRLEDRHGIDDRDVNEMLAELYAEVETKKQWLHNEEETFERGQERLQSLKRQHAELLRTMNQCKRRRKERRNIREMLRGNGDNYERRSSIDSGSDSDYSSSRHHRSRHEKAKKERKRLRRFQSKVSLQFQLLQSECQRSKLEVEKALAEVRSKYADSYLFGNSFTF